MWPQLLRPAQVTWVCGLVPGPCVSTWQGSHFLSRPDTGMCESAG